MAKKKHRNYRAEQARRKNEEDRAYREKVQKRKDYWDKNGKTISIAVVAVIVALVLIRLVYSFFFGPGGSLPSWGGKLRGVKENWVITDLSETSSKKMYYKLGEMEAPEGYSLDPEMASSDENAQTFYYVADDENAPVAKVYVSGVKNYTAEDQLARLVDYGYYVETSGAKKATVAGREVDYAYFVFDPSVELDAEEGTMMYGSLCFYIDTIKDSCVLMMIDSPKGLAENVPSEETMLALAEDFLPLLTVVEK